MFGRGELDNVGREEVAGDYEEEGGADEDVVAFVVVAAEADEDAVLGGWSALYHFCLLEVEVNTLLKFSIIKRRFPTTV